MSFVPSPVAEVYVDQEKLSQVVANLISNAIKYSPEANKIIVTTRLQKYGVVLLVQDFGIGIPKANREKVFEQFYPVTGSTQSTFPGMGIG